mgnify:CR=1 FL=1
MPDLAGFDVIVELAVDTLADIVDSSGGEQARPAIDGAGTRPLTGPR